MSLFSRILAKLGLRRKRSGTIGTAKIIPNDPPTAPSDRKSAHASMPTNEAPTSEKEVKGNRSTLDKKGKRRGSS